MSNNQVLEEFRSNLDGIPKSYEKTRGYIYECLENILEERKSLFSETMKFWFPISSSFIWVVMLAIIYKVLPLSTIGFIYKYEFTHHIYILNNIFISALIFLFITSVLIQIYRGHLDVEPFSAADSINKLKEIIHDCSKKNLSDPNMYQEILAEMSDQKILTTFSYESKMKQVRGTARNLIFADAGVVCLAVIVAGFIISKRQETPHCFPANLQELEAGQHGKLCYEEIEMWKADGVKQVPQAQASHH